MTGWSRWRAALRVARRDAWRHKVRSMLVIALIGLPVLVIGTVAVLYRTWQVPPSQQVTRVIGHADAWLTWYGEDNITQSPKAPYDGGINWGGRSARSDRRPTPTDEQVAAQLPPGTRVIALRTRFSGTTIYTRWGLTTAQMVGLDYADPIAAGMVTQLSGRAPRSDNEAAITRSLARSSGLGVGDVLRTAEPARSFHIVGIVRATDDRHNEAIYVQPAAYPLTPTTGQFPTFELGWLASSPRPVTWDAVIRLDSAGFVTLSRHVYLDPPPKSQQPYLDGAGDRPISAHAIATGTLIGGMALLEVVLLAGPSFAVGARRRQRDLALLAAVGGSRRDLRRTVLADAVVLGLAAGAAAVGLAIVVAAIVEPLLIDYAPHDPGSFTVPVVQLVALVVVSVTTALLAAALPARRAARTDVVAALAGRRGTTRAGWRWPVVGVLLAGAGVSISLGVLGPPTATTIVTGVALAEVGVICATPVLIGAVAHIARWVPLSGRIALRDASRNRTAAAPAVAAVMAAVIGAVAMATAATSAEAQNRSRYLPELPHRDAYVSLRGDASRADAVLAAVHKAMPHVPVRLVRTVAGSCSELTRTILTSAGSRCTDVETRTTENFAGFGSSLPRVLVDDGPGIADLLGHESPGAVAALAAGRAVVFDSSAVVSGRARVLITRVSPGAHLVGRAIVRTVPATYVATAGFAPAATILPRRLAASLHVGWQAAGVLADSDRSIGASQRQALALALATLGTPHSAPLSAVYEAGYSDSTAWIPFALVGAAGFIAIFAALIATALANVDSRPDLITLGAVGASPGTRRVLSMARAAVIAGLGAWIGTVAGVLPASAWVRSVDASVVLPWPVLLLAALGIPAAAALLTGLFTRTRPVR